MQSLTNIRTSFIDRKLGGKVSYRANDLIGTNSRLTLNRGFVAQEYGNKESLFLEIGILPMERALNMEAIKRIEERSLKRKTVSENIFIGQFVELFKQAFFSIWDPGKGHVILHSSGYDSRVLSWTIKKLAEENGRDWMGRTFFICLSPEQEQFELIMDYLGFAKESQEIFYRIYKLYINFESIWKKVNGCACYPDNSAAIAVNYVKEEKLGDNNQDIQVFMADFFNEIWDGGFFNYVSRNSNPNPIFEWFEKYYHSRYAQFLGMIPGEVIHPILDEDILNLILESDINLDKRMRLKMVRSLDIGLFELPRMDDKDIRKSKISDISDDKFKEKLINDYRKSWYAKQTGLNFDRKDVEMEIKPFWSHWTAASWCEHLINNMNCAIK